MAKNNQFLFLRRWAALYASPTDPEIALEPAVAALGVPYRAQHPVFGKGAILDFAVYPRGLNAPGVDLEVDGSSHRTKRGRENDVVRTAKLTAAGWTVWRCTNEEALADPEGTVARMVADLTEKGLWK